MSKAQSKVPSEEITVILPSMAEERLARLQAAMKQVDTEHPTPQALTALRASFDEAPEIWRKIFDVTDTAIDRVVKTIVSGTIGQELLKRQVRDLRAEMGAGETSAMERTLINHIALCWLRVQSTELAYARVMEGKELSIRQADHWDRRLGAAQQRYLRACESLARVRRLARPPRPPLQVNIGGQQVNVAGGTTAAVVNPASHLSEGL